MNVSAYQTGEQNKKNNKNMADAITTPFVSINK